MFWNILTSLCAKNDITPNALCLKLGFSNATSTKWKKGATPHDTTLKKIADYFGVTTDFLLGKEASKNPPSPPEDVPYAFYKGDENTTDGRQTELENYIKLVTQRENPPSEESGSNEDELDKELLKRLCSLNEDELARVDAFVQGLLANRST